MKAFITNNPTTTKMLLFLLIFIPEAMMGSLVICEVFEPETKGWYVSLCVLAAIIVVTLYIIDEMADVIFEQRTDLKYYRSKYREDV